MKAMVITLDQIVEETAQLPADVVADLVERILVVRHGGFGPGVENAWKKESQLRVKEIAAGKVEGIPAEDVMARARRIVQK